jgi:acyl transferase domain-containing protein
MDDRNRDSRAEVESALVRMTAAVLSCSPEAIDVGAELGQAGCSSLTLTRLANRISEHFAIDVDPTIFFEHPTIAGLARHLIAAFGESVCTARAARPPGREAASVELSSSSARIGGETRRSSGSEPVAIVGMSARFPGCSNLQAFWDALVEGRECISEIPGDRWDWRAIAGDPRDVNRTNIRWGGFIDGAAEFDPLFFGISPKEAERMDPQQRLLLMCALAAIEDAGHAPGSLAGTRTGVFVGLVSHNGYSQRLARANLPIEAHSTVGSAASMGPNRLSYWLDLRGPSEPVETTCSSSLVAIHRAMRAIQTGECDMALAGGVNLLISPAMHVSFTKAGMLSADGRCRTFSAAANGYVRGEGVAMLLLKPLSAAQRDGDEIYALLRGGAVNHGGRASSLSAPNPVAQAGLLVNAYTEAGIDPRSVGYIEAHGTGTPLGDPIEINALKAAFRELDGSTASESEPWRCGIGSVKSNIGHLEAAAGVAGLIKVVLQLQRRMLVASVNSEPINPHIQLAGSPFHVVTRTQPWPAVVGRDGLELPRRAGVSSFGLGGVNAHLIVEEYVDTARPVTATSPPDAVQIVLSARDEERLQEQTRQLLAALQATDLVDDDLVRIAYTLQAGRDAMAHRLAFHARSLAELRETLSAFVAGTANEREVFRGVATRTVSSDRSADEALLQFWTRGGAVDWRTFNAVPPKRMRLPTYPFARERYWVDVPDGDPFDTRTSSSAPTSSERLHPLVHVNISTFAHQRYRSRFGGDEPFLRDHLINGRRVFPAAASLEMARAAVSASMGCTTTSVTGMSIRDVVWERPLYVDGPTTVCIELSARADDGVRFQLFTETPTSGAIVHASGVVVTANGSTLHADRIDLHAFRRHCHTAITPSALEEQLAARGMVYGPFYRTLRSAALGLSGDGEPFVLAEVMLPPDDNTLTSCGLHPALIDAALRVSAGLRLRADGAPARELAMPFAIDTIDVLAATPPAAIVHVRASRPDVASRSRRTSVPASLDVTMCEPDGRVCVQVRGLRLRVIEPMRAAPPVLLRPFWTERAVAERPAPGAATAARWVWLDCGMADAVDLLRRMSPKVNWRVLPESDGTSAGKVSAAADVVFAHLQAHMRSTPSEHLVVQIVVPPIEGADALSALAGLFRSAYQESPYVRGQVVVLTKTLPLATLARILVENARAVWPADMLVRVDGRSRQIETWSPIADDPVPAGLSPWRNGGVYLITGGAGRLAAAVARDVHRHAPGAHVVLADRIRVSTPVIVDDDVRNAGGSVLYQELDVTSGESVRAGVQAVLARHGCVTGLVHCAGVIDDSFIIRKARESLRAVLAPKVAGIMALDEATASQPLEIVVAFSSIGSLFGSVGQCDYATANGFLDWFAAYRSGLVRAGARRGRTLAINWPLWEEGGMRVDSEVQAALGRASTAPLSTAAGLAALTRAWHSGGERVAVIPSAHQRLAELTGTSHDAATSSDVPLRRDASDLVDAGERTTSMNSATLHLCTIRLLARRVASLLSIPPDQLDPVVPLEDYGVDSLTGLHLVRTLEREFGPLQKTLMFDFPTLEALARHFITAHADTVRELIPFETDRAATQ